MSIFSGIIKEAHTFAAWAEKELEKLFSEAPKIEQIADTVLTYVGPVLQTIVTAESGAPAGAIVAAVIGEAQRDLTAVSGLIYDIGAQPSVASLITAVKDDIAGLLTAGHVTNANSVSLVQKVVSELAALIGAFAGSKSPAAA